MAMVTGVISRHAQSLRSGDLTEPRFKCGFGFSEPLVLTCMHRWARIVSKCVLLGT